MPIGSWSTTPASNNAAVPNGWPEGMAPSGVNDVGRQMMADIRTFYDDQINFRGIPQNSQSASYGVLLTDAGYHILHPSGAAAGHTFTIPANASVAFPVGTTISFVNLSTNSLGIAITTDTLNLAGSSSTGTRALGQFGIATALKVTTTSWIISGPGLT
jgi:hypothetical protein